jgi:hypothetical protein
MNRSVLARTDRPFQEARTMLVVPEVEEPWAAAEREDPALLADRLGLPLTPEQRQRLRRPPEPDDPHVSMVTVVHGLWEASYGADRPPRGSISAVEAETSGRWLIEKLQHLAGYQAQTGERPDSPAGVLADWLFLGQVCPA